MSRYGDSGKASRSLHWIFGMTVSIPRVVLRVAGYICISMRAAAASLAPLSTIPARISIPIHFWRLCKPRCLPPVRTAGPGIKPFAVSIAEQSPGACRCRGKLRGVLHGFAVPGRCVVTGGQMYGESQGMGGGCGQHSGLFPQLFHLQKVMMKQ